MATPAYIASLQGDLAYSFSNMRNLVEALRAPGAGFDTQFNVQGVDGYRRLSQLGESLLRMIIIDEGYTRGDQRGQ